ncbi:hypothetical protein VHEMI09123 [[Torrubiella] hemipterigena]|uniref:Transcription factor domain-containing protein n=1 Tax=[Torrubiella] hemipterigena TaxID=1531966 RepID=A0A0A1TQX6_9HYPO|nr:hypothetical protein VHEMI09123 [[Torrubiella] hemipterigena]
MRYKDATTKGQGDVRPVTFVQVPGISAKHRQTAANKSILSTVRSHAMKDYVRRQIHLNSANNGVVHDPPNRPVEQSRQMGRFRLASAARSSKQRRGNNKRSIPQDSVSSRAINLPDTSQPLLVGAIETQQLFDAVQHQTLQSSGYLHSNRLDPFDVNSLKLAPQSEQLVFYYHHGYRMNKVALQFEWNCFSHANDSPAMLYAIPYIISIELDLRRGTAGSRSSLYHGAAAFRYINDVLASSALDDYVVAAISIVAAAENLSGNFAAAELHMAGLEHIVTSRGGIENVPSVFGRVATWADFCDANLRRCQPRFSQPRSAVRLPPRAAAAHGFDTPEAILSVAHIVAALRDISHAMSSNFSVDTKGVSTSQAIYNLEYELCLLSATTAPPIRAGDGHMGIQSLRLALHIYLYLTIRELPRSSSLMGELAARLQAALAPTMDQTSTLEGDSRNWYLWMLFLGYCTSKETIGPQWFLASAIVVCDALHITNPDDVRSSLTKVLWTSAGEPYAVEFSTAVFLSKVERLNIKEEVP